MINLLQVDKSGSDIFEKDYSIAVVLNKKEVYGINIPQKIKDDILNSFRTGKLNINHRNEKQRKNRLRIRFHTAVIIKLIEEIILDLNEVGNINLELCNDIDGHFHEIKDMIFKHFEKQIPTLKLEDIVLAKFQKPSFIDFVCKSFREKKNINEYNLIKLNSEELIKIIKK
jgi:hypothetical protein